MEEFDLLPQTSLTYKNIDHVLSNSFGFGGNCSTLISQELMGKTFINGIGCISAQLTADGFPQEFKLDQTANFLPLQKPEYKDYFSPIASRRMAKG